jgi:hypothetical protein
LFEPGDQARFGPARLHEPRQAFDEHPDRSWPVAGKRSWGNEDEPVVWLCLLGTPGCLDTHKVTDVLGDETALLQLGGDENLWVGQPPKRRLFLNRHHVESLPTKTHSDGRGKHLVEEQPHP